MTSGKYKHKKRFTKEELKEHIALNHKKWVEKNKERNNEYHRNWCKSHRESRNKTNRKWREKK